MDKGVVKVNCRVLSKWRIKSSNLLVGTRRYMRVSTFICIYFSWLVEEAKRQSQNYINNFL